MKSPPAPSAWTFHAINEKMKQIFILILWYPLSSGFSSKLEEKGYVKYHKEFAKIEELIVNEGFVEAELKFDSLFTKYKVKFAKDYLIAGQVSFINGHKNKGREYLRCAIGMGVNLDCLKHVRLFREKIAETDWNQLKDEESKLRKVYFKNINLELYQDFHRRYQKEQDSKGSEIYKSVVYSNFNRIISIIESIGFPGEALIGIDNQTLAKSISDCDCDNSKIIVTLLHYNYPISEIGEEKLISEIENGNLHPREFATIYNFERYKVSRLYRESNKKYESLPKYDFNFPFGDQISNIEKVNFDREKFGICKYEVDKKKIEIAQKYGMKLKFGYK